MLILVMGVCGSGKTTIGKQLAEVLGARFIEGDDFHPPENIARMAAGIPLDDTTRQPWLLALAEELRRNEERKETVVLACSALKDIYRRLLLKYCPDHCIVWLSANPELLTERLLARQGHFMPPSLLQSQFADLEEPATAIKVDVGVTQVEIIKRLLSQIPRSPEQGNIG